MRHPTAECFEIRCQVERIANGDSAATTWLYESFAARLRQRLAWRYPTLEAGDLVHDAFLLCLKREARVLRRLLQRTPPAELSRERLERYLWNLACGLATNRIRSARRRSVALAPRERCSTAESSPPPRPESRDALVSLTRRLRERGGRLYTYFELRYFDELSPAEIARSTGWSRKATYKLKQKVQQAVQECACELGILG